MTSLSNTNNNLGGTNQPAATDIAESESVPQRTHAASITQTSTNTKPYSHPTIANERTPLSPRDLEAPRPPYSGQPNETEFDDVDGGHPSVSSIRHRWLDYLPLPYDLVAPKMLRVNVMRHSLSPEQRRRWEVKGAAAAGISAGSAGGRQSSQARSRHGATSPKTDALSRDPNRATATDTWTPSDIPKPLQLRQARLDFVRRIFAEVVGTAILIFAHGTLRMKRALGTISHGENALFSGFTLVMLIYSLGEVSGAHFNPVVTLAFCMRRMFPWVWLIPYYIAEFVGAIIGAALIRGFFGQDNAREASSFVSDKSLLNDTTAMLFETMLTFMLLFTILSVCQRGRVVGVHAALAVGAVIGVDVALGADITGGSMNPFRSLGPAIVNGPSQPVWIMVAGPYIGGLIAVFATWCLATSQEDPARGPAMGKGKAEPDVEHDRDEDSDEDKRL